MAMRKFFWPYSFVLDINVSAMAQQARESWQVLGPDCRVMNTRRSVIVTNFNLCSRLNQ